MPGSLEERGEHTFRLRYDAPPDPLTGKRRQKVVTLKNVTRRQAERKLAELVADAGRGLNPEPSAELLKDFLPRWLESMRPSWRHRTYLGHRSAVTKHLVPALGHIALGKLTPQHVQGWYGSCQLQPQTVRLYGRYLSEALRTAVEWDLIPKNPAERAKPPREEEREAEALSPEELRRILLALEGSWLKVPALLALTTGLRPGELVALRWADVDLAARTLRVRRQMTRGPAGWIEGPPKTRRGRRQVLMGPEVAALLAEHRAAQEKARALAGAAWQDGDFILCKGDGSRWKPDDIPRRWRRLLEKAGLPPVRFYDLRHSQASYILAGGEDIIAAAARMGHSPAMLLKTYAHMIPGKAGRSAAVSDEVLGEVRRDGS